MVAMQVGKKFTLVKSLPENCCFSLEKWLFRLRDKKNIVSLSWDIQIEMKN